MSPVRRGLLVIVLVLAPARTSGAQGSEWVEVESRALLAGGRSAEDTKRDALYGALAEAVRRVAGVTVQGSSVAVRSDSAGRVVDRYVEAVRVDAAGRALAWQVVREGWRTAKVRAIGTQVYYDLSLRVLVQRERGTADPGFAVTLATNADRFAVRGTAPSENDEVVLRVTSTMAATLTIVSIVHDSVYVLAPNVLMPEVRATAFVAREIPDATLRGSGLRFRVSLPDGVAQRTELLAVIATRHPVPLGAVLGEGTARDTGVLTLGDFNAWLVAIPRSERAVAQVPVEVRRAR
ncbi:MAG: hypothetical protein C0497_03260 [Gemmatimonas sp.]|nr:hypothetical protein [Gemmatimonas sp.]